MQELHVESTAGEQESGDTAESRIARRDEHTQRSERTDVPDIDPRLFHGQFNGP
jgi:hypothetical protein